MNLLKEVFYTNTKYRYVKPFIKIDGSWVHRRGGPCYDLDC